MKLKLNKKAVKSLSKNQQTLLNELTPQVGGAAKAKGPGPSNPIVCHSAPVCWTINYCYTS